MKVGIIMGSESDLPVMEAAAEVLESLNIPYEKKWFQPTEPLNAWLLMPRRQRAEA